MALVLNAATRREVNEIKLKLRALGVNLDNVKWKPEAVYSNPTGFDFTTEDWKRIEQAAEKSSKLKLDPTDMPGHDPWRKAKFVSVGWTQLGKPPYVHLDVALSRPGLCRVYIRQHGPALTEHMGVVVSAETVYAKDPVVR
jgi:hypothetical protein